ncbi:MAG: 5-(carboxyamino)imidazole ribonucleotide mutase [Proteobacteria bacterium]|nr:5-(carboxyamino)imidazole ribonucleotide mutase [Pseudomonadota bacterium]
MGSRSDWATLCETSRELDRLGIPHECRVVSAHRTPDRLFEYAETAADRGLEVLIAGAGGAAHLPGMLAAKTWLPVLAVPVQSRSLHGIDSLLSIVQMPRGVPVGTLAIGEAGAVNAAILAASMLAVNSPDVRDVLVQRRAAQTEMVLANDDPTVAPPAAERPPLAGAH